MHALLAVLEKREASLPRLCYWLRSGEGKGETGQGTVEEREREREREGGGGRERERERESVGKEILETQLIEGCPR